MAEVLKAESLYERCIARQFSFSICLHLQPFLHPCPSQVIVRLLSFAMKVLHIASTDLLDSASRAARELHCALLKAGVESRLLVQYSLSNRTDQSDPTDRPDLAGIEQIAKQNGVNDQKKLLQNFCFDENEAAPTASAFHIGYPGVSLADHPAVLDCDLIHLHQVAGVLSPSAIRELSSLRKPVIWSLPDAWAFTGGCFQPGACTQFIESCAECSQLRADTFHLPALLLADKIALLAGITNLTLIAPSEYLALQARSSKVFRTSRIEPILPFAPTSVSSGSTPLRIVFTCDSPGSQDRSARLLKELLEVTQTYGAFRKLVLDGKVSLVVSGIAPEQTRDINLPLQFSGGRATQNADLLVFPKLDENRAAAVFEARAQGVPVLAFDQAGIREAIEHKKNGWLVKTQELRPLAEALGFLAANPDLVRSLSQPTTPVASNEAALSKTLALYRELVEKPAPDSPDYPTERGASLELEFQKIVASIAQLAVAHRVSDEKLARVESAEKRIQGAEQLLAEAQASLATLERRQQRLIESGQLSPATLKELGKIQKSAAGLRNKLKWRARRLKIYNAPVRLSAQSSKPIPQTPPQIPAWAQLFHRLFLQKHWMKHGKKDQYPPRPVRAERFPKPKLRKENLPRIAIVTPSFMQGQYLEATIRSIVDQEYPNLAYAVHDGGSTDSTLEVIHRYADRLTLWASQPDSGQARAIVSGFEKISGQIMAWVNSDDMLVPGALRFVGEYFATHPEVDAVYGNRIIVNEHGKEIARWVLPPHDPAITPYLDPVPQETLFWRASLWEKVGGLDPSFRFALDWDLVLRFQQSGANIVRLPYFLGCFRVHSQQKLSARAESIGAEEIGFLRQRETGGPVTLEQIQPYKEWMETCAAVYSRLLELGIRF